MTEARVGRLLAACLHQAILDEIPQRIDFYENWLSSEGLRDGSIGLAPMTAVLGFLRTEGPAYDRVVSRAGRLAAEWTIPTLSAWRSKRMTWLPRGWRARRAMKVTAEIVSDISSNSRAIVRVRGSVVRVEVKGSLFCAVRETQSHPLCLFYMSAAVETLSRFGLSARGRVESCRAVTGDTCVLVFDIDSLSAATDPAVAA